MKDFAGHVVNGWMLSGIGYFHSGLPYTMRTAGSLAREFDVSGTAIEGLSTGMNGYGGDRRVYGVGRNTYRYPETWKVDLRLAKRFNLGQMRQFELMAESYNLFNHQNVTELRPSATLLRQARSTAVCRRSIFSPASRAARPNSANRSTSTRRTSTAKGSCNLARA